MKTARLVTATLAAFAATAGAQELTLRDNIGRDWANEPIVWELPGAKGDSVLVQRDGQPIPAQVVTTTNGVEALVVIDKLAKDASTKLTAELGKTGPSTTDLKIEEGKDGVVMGNSFTAIKLPGFNVRTASGNWTSGASYTATTAKPGTPKVEILERGPVRARARVTTTFDNGKTHAVTVSLWNGSHSIDLD